MIGKKIRKCRIVEKLSAGGMGEVYRAHDEGLDRDVAIKFLRERFEGKHTTVSRFIREAKAASALNHPNIVTIFDAGTSKPGGRFIIMELVRGRTLREWIRTEPSNRAIANVIAQAARALAAAHNAGIVHRDIKPENIMVRDDGYVKVLDFGLARWENPGEGPTVDTRTASGTILGTLRYMSPEQSHGGPLSPKTDIFSLGLVWYELVAGRHPFSARSEVESLQALSSQPIRPPSYWNADIPRALETLMLNMLNREVKRRPSASEVAQALDLGASDLMIDGHDNVKSHRALVGRHRELVKLRAVMEATARGLGMFVLVAGEPGIGKTALLEGFLDETADSQKRAAIGKGHCSERLAGAEAYSALFESLENLLRDTPRLAPVMRRTAPNWYLYATRESQSEAKDAAGHLSSRELLSRELTAFLEEASSTIPVVLFVDDIHWADNATLDMLTYAALRLDSSRVLLLATFRTEELALHHERFEQTLLDLQARHRCQRMDLGFLDTADIDAFVSLEFPNNSFPDNFAKWIHLRTEGNPFFVSEVLLYLRDTGVIGLSGETWTLSMSLSGIGKDLPQSIVGMVRRKIESLPDEDRKLLAAASVQGVEFDSAVVARTLPGDTVEIEERLERLQRINGIVQSLGERDFADGSIAARYRFVHYLFYDALYASLQPARKAAWSAAAAEALLVAYKHHAVEIAAPIAFLFEAARDFARAAYHFSIAADNAAKVFAYGEAVLLARRGLKSLKTLPESAEATQAELDMQLKLGIPLLAAKGYGNDEVQQAFDTARRLCLQVGEHPRLFPAVWGLVTFYSARLDVPNASHLSGQLMRMAKDSQDPTFLMVANLACGFCRYFSARFEDALSHLGTYRTLDHGVDRVGLASRYGLEPGILLRAFEARVLWWLGYPEECLAVTSDSLLLARGLVHAPTKVFAAAMAGTTWQIMRDVPRVEALANEMKSLGAEYGMDLWSAEGRFFEAWVAFERGDPDAGLKGMRKGLQDYAITGTQLFLPHGYSVLAACFGEAGRPQEGLDVVYEARRLPCFGFRPVIFSTADFFRVEGVLLAAIGNFDAAETQLRNSLRLAREQKTRVAELRAATALSRLLRTHYHRLDGKEFLPPSLEWFSGKLETAEFVEGKAEFALLDAGRS